MTKSIFDKQLYNLDISFPAMPLQTFLISISLTRKLRSLHVKHLHADYTKVFPFLNIFNH